MRQLRGTLVVLADAGFSDEEAMNWLLNRGGELGSESRACPPCRPQG